MAEKSMALANVGLYERKEDCQAWRFVGEHSEEWAKHAADVNKEFGVQTTYIHPINGSYPQWLDAYTEERHGDD